MEKGKKIIAGVFCFLLIALSCSRSEGYQEIKIPSSPVLIEKFSWAVCNTTNMHMYSEPDDSSQIISTIWKASIMEILSRSPKQETKYGQEAFWFRVRYNEFEGWVFGAFLQFVPTRGQAVALSRGM